jgi:ATP-binding cassette, subfamily C, bacterial LapB
VSGPVLAFDISATRGAKLTRIAAPEADQTRSNAPVLGVVAANKTDPLAAPTSDPFSPKAKARADLAATYAGLLGVDVSRGDLLERMTLSGGSDVTALWPALAEMVSGQVLLVLSQTDATITIYDRTCPDNRAEVPLTEFAPVGFAGRVLRADVGMPS